MPVRSGLKALIKDTWKNTKNPSLGITKNANNARLTAQQNVDNQYDKQIFNFTNKKTKKENDIKDLQEKIEQTPDISEKKKANIMEKITRKQGKIEKIDTEINKTSEKKKSHQEKRLDRIRQAATKDTRGTEVAIDEIIQNNQEFIANRKKNIQKKEERLATLQKDPKNKKSIEKLQKEIDEENNKIKSIEEENEKLKSSNNESRKIDNNDNNEHDENIDNQENTEEQKNMHSNEPDTKSIDNIDPEHNQENDKDVRESRAENHNIPITMNGNVGESTTSFRDTDTNNYSGSQTGENSNNKNITILSFLKNLVYNIAIPLFLILINFLIFLIVIFSIINIILVITGLIITLFTERNEYIYQTFQYKLLNYVELKDINVDIRKFFYSNNEILKNLKYVEPFGTKIYIINVFLGIILGIYIILGIIIILLLIAVFIISINNTIHRQSNFGKQSDLEVITTTYSKSGEALKNQQNIFSKIMNIPNLNGLIFTFFLMGYHVLFFKEIILPILSKNKTNIYNIDIKITEQLKAINKEININNNCYKESNEDDKCKIELNTEFVRNLIQGEYTIAISKINENIKKDTDTFLLKKALIQTMILILYSNARNSIKDVDTGTIELLNNYFFTESESEFNFEKINNISYISLFNINSNIIISSEICNSELPIDVAFNKKEWSIGGINKNFESHLNTMIDEINKDIDYYKNNNINIQISFILFLFFKAIIVCVLYILYTSINITSKDTDPNVYKFNKLGIGFLTTIPYIGTKIAKLLHEFSNFERYITCKIASSLSNQDGAYEKCLLNINNINTDNNETNNFPENDQNNQSNQSNQSNEYNNN